MITIVAGGASKAGTSIVTSVECCGPSGGKRRTTRTTAASRRRITELVSFAQGPRRDLDAVTAALRSPYSQGQTEGQVNRLKMLKRQTYGRAHLDLLRRRVLYHAACLWHRIWTRTAI